MNAFILLTACVAASQAQYIAHPYGYATHQPYALPYAGVPVTVNAAPAPIVAAPPLSPSSQFQAQDEFGNIQYGYSNINSQKHEVGNTYGGVQGSYSYVDANGEIQTTNYVADHLGFRVESTNLPVAPTVELKQPIHTLQPPVYTGVAPEPPVYTGVAPLPVEDTPEVKAAKAEFQAAFDAATARKKRSTPADTAVLEIPEPVVVPAPAALPLAYGAYPYGAPAAVAGAYPYGAPAAVAGAYPYAAPTAVAHPYALGATAYTHGLTSAYVGGAVVPGVVASAPVTREAELHTVKLNPGHAVAYRVY